MIGFLPISIVSAGMSLLRTGAGALSAFFGSSDKQFTSTYASTLTANPAMHRTRLNSYLKPVPTTRPNGPSSTQPISWLVERNLSRSRPRSTLPLKSHSVTDPKHHCSQPRGRPCTTLFSLQITDHPHSRSHSPKSTRKKNRDGECSSRMSNRHDASGLVRQ